MKQCGICQVDVDGQHKSCPLCSKPLGAPTGSITAYPDYQKHYQTDKTFTFYKCITFIAIAGSLIGVTINFLTWHLNDFVWSIILAAILAYVWIVIKKSIYASLHIGKKILYNYAAVSLVMFVIDLCVDFPKWSTNYVIPLFGIGATFLMTLLAVIHKSLWKEDVGYLIAMFFINLCPFILFIFRLSDVVWPSVATILYSLVTIIGMVIFSDRKLKIELKKRFHV